MGDEYQIPGLIGGGRFDGPAPGGSELTSYVYNGTRSAAISIVPRETLNNAAPNVSQQQLQCVAANSYIGFGYGRCRTAIRILYPIIDYSAIPATLLIPGFIGRGPIDAIEAVQLDNLALVAGITNTNYTGAAGQAADASLVAAWASQFAPKVYADAMAGVAYTVLRCSPGPLNRIGNFTVTARHLKVYDPRLDSTNGGTGTHRLLDPTTWAWSQNPVLALAHFLTTKGYGPEETLDWSTVITCANIADQTLTADGTTQTRRQIGIFFDQPQDVDAIEETLRSYAGVFIDRGSGATVSLIADAAVSSSFAFTNATPSNYLSDSIDITKRGRANSPSVVTIRYTDTTQTPWGTQEVTVKAPGVDAGTEAWVETSIDWPGCQSAGMAYREAVRRLNEFTLADLTIRLMATDEALQVRRGDVVTVTDSEGFSAKPFRVKDITPSSLGRWQVSLTEYQPGLYSDTIYNGPVIGDTSLPSPSDVPVVTGLTLSEEVFQTLGGGTYSSRIVATWAAPTTWSFTLGYKVTVLDGARVIDTAFLAGSSSVQYRTPALQEGISYTINVQAQSTTGALGTAAANDLFVLGSKLPPSDVGAVTLVTNGSQVILKWGAATDIDLTGYEIRVGTTAQTWDTAATQIVRLEGVATTTTIVNLVPGTYRFFVKARDSIRATANPYGQYSTNALYADATITSVAISDAGYTLPLDASTAINGVALQSRENSPPVWLQQWGVVASGADDTFGGCFTVALGTYTNLLYTYGYTISSGGISTGWVDLGQTITGTFSVDWRYLFGAGSGLLLSVSTDGVNAIGGIGVGAVSIVNPYANTLYATARYVKVSAFYFNPGGFASLSSPIVRVVVSEQMAATSFRMNDKAYASPGRDATASDARALLGVQAAYTRVYHNANTAIVTATDTKIAFNSERWDTDTIHDTTTNNTRLTCKTAGVYRITGCVEFAAAGGTVRKASILLNNTYTLAAVALPPVAGTPTQLIVATQYQLIVNDYVELVVHQDSGANLNVSSVSAYSPEFMMERIAS